MLGYVARMAAELGLDALQFVAWRAGVATVALLVVGVLVGGRGRASRLPDVRLLTRDRQLALLVAGLCGALLNIAIFAAFLRTTIAVALICFYTFPAIVTLAAVRLYGDRLDGRRAAALVLSSAGLGLVLLAPWLHGGGLLIDPIGVGLALVAAIGQAAFVLIAGRGFSPLPSMQVATWVVIVAVVASVGVIAVVGDLASLVLPLNEPRLWVWVLAGGLAGAAVPTTAFIAGIGMIGPARAAILMTFEPVVGVLLAGMLLGEHPSELQLLGGAAVLAAAVVLQSRPPAPVAEEELSPLV